MLIFFMSIALFTACKNDKGGKDKIDREKDDYRSSDKDAKDDDKEKTSTDYKDDKNTDKPDDKEEKTDYTASSGWPKSERVAFIISCEREAVAAGQTRIIAGSYCQCMLDKMETSYPDIKMAEKLTMEDIEKFGKKYRDGCLSER